MSTKYTMLGGISGTRNGVDWPKPGQPAPADLTPREITRLTEARIIAATKPTAGETEIETAEDSTPVETATTGRRRAKAAATTED